MIICFEGINGAGKSTQIKRVCDELARRGIAYEVLHDPGVRDDHPAQKLRPLFVYGDQWADPRTPLLIGSAARNEMTNEIRRLAAADPRLVIILDRYELSTYAYQTLMLEDGGFTADEALAMIGSLHDILRCATPDLLVFLDLPPEIAFPRRMGGRRITDDKKDDQFEARGLAFARRLADKYRLALGSGDSLGLYRRQVSIDVDEVMTPDAVFMHYWPHIEELLVDVGGHHPRPPADCGSAAGPGL